MTPLRRVAVLGAGTMGSRIAAHFANAGIPALLLDVVLPNQPKRNAAAMAGIESAMKQKPGGFFTQHAASLVTPGNFEDNLGDLRGCDWIVEAVVENLEVKRDLLRKVAAVRRRAPSSPPIPAAFRWRSISEGFPPRLPRAFPGHALLQSAALPASGRDDPRRRHAARRFWSSSPISATATWARAWSRARTRRTSSPTASAASSAPPSISSPSKATTPSKKWTRSPVR